MKSDKEKLEYINKELNDNYTSLAEVDWYYISLHQKLSEDFIREFADKVDWIQISIQQKLSENFIREFQDKVGWYCIPRHQKISEPFIREFQDRIKK